MPDPNEQLIARLRRIEGQVRGIARMLDDQRSCEDVVTQLMAVRSSIDTVGAVVLDSHLEGCVSGRSADELIDTVYGDVPLASRPFARMSLVAHLEKLVRDGRVRSDGSGDDARYT